MKPVLVTDSHEAIVTIVSHGGQQDRPYFLLKYTGQLHTCIKTIIVSKYEENGHLAVKDLQFKMFKIVINWKEGTYISYIATSGRPEAVVKLLFTWP